LATTSYTRPQSNLPKEIANLDYERYYGGYAFGQPVKINEIKGQNVREIRFDSNDFKFGDNKVDLRKLRSLNFAGFRMHYPVNTARYKDEVLLFLDTNYFRGLGKDQTYGLLGHGPATDTSLSSGEEFPRFTEFWVERPAAGARELTIYELLNSRRVTGAYRFISKPGVDTAIAVKIQLYLREKMSPG